MNYRILTDSSADLPASLSLELQVDVVPLCVQFQGQEHENYPNGDSRNTLAMKPFYDALRQAAPTSTTAANPEKWATYMRPTLEQGEDLLVLAFSSGLSATYSAAVLAANELMEQFPGRTIRVVDTLAASLGQGLLVYLAAKRREAGESLEQVALWVEENKRRLCHWFTVDDLMFLKRGGRVSAATAMVGTMLKIKPVLHVDDAGKLISVSKARGRKAAIEALAAKVGALGIHPEDQTVFISHGDCLADAQNLADLIRAQYGVKNFVIDYVGPVIGSHSGPGTLALFFLGEHR